MEKKCFVIMPGGDPEGYAQGHFGRVYQYLIAPACSFAGLMPIRVEDIMVTNDSAFNVLKNIIESDMVICDLSSRNPNVVYGFAIRRALGLPVTLMRDLKTKNILGVDELGEVEYDESLRIDTVQKTIESLAEALKNAFTNKGEVNALLKRLGIETEKKITTVDTDLVFDLPTSTEQIEPEQKEPALPVITPVPDYVGDPFTQKEIDKLKIGDSLFHITRGKGKITTIKSMKNEKIANIQFESGSTILVVGTTGYFRKIKEG